MGSTSFQIFKVSDSELFKSLKSFAEAELVDDLNDLNVSLGFEDEQSTQLTLQLNQLEENEAIKNILEAQSAIVHYVSLPLSSLGGNLRIERKQGLDNIVIDFDNNTNINSLIKLLTVPHKYFRTYVRTESIDKLLGDELAEFYRKREEALLRLEDLTQNLIQQNEDYRSKLDSEREENENELKDEYNKLNENLQNTYDNKEAALNERSNLLDDRASELDDRDSRHARRQIRKDLKDALAARGQEFTLTKKTTQKRIPIHALFIFLIVTTGYFLIQNVLIDIDNMSGVDFWFQGIRLILSVVAIAATIVFYLRWNDSWFRQHADEEFQLKRFELDIDRASWVVEMALEWKDEKGTEIPEELIERFTENLFKDQNIFESAKHPSEELATALLSATSGLTLKVPGFGELALDKRSIKKFKEFAEKSGAQIK